MKETDLKISDYKRLMLDWLINRRKTKQKTTEEEQHKLQHLQDK
jgi:hypothetical protein